MCGVWSNVRYLNAQVGIRTKAQARIAMCIPGPIGCGVDVFIGLRPSCRWNCQSTIHIVHGSLVESDLPIPTPPNPLLDRIP